MTHITKWIGKLLFVVMAVALIVYAASRTLDFVSSTLGADDQMIGYLALFATTGGALAWLAVFLWDSEGIAQKSIALLMVGVDVIGEITLFTIDTLMQSGANGVIGTLSPEEIRSTVLGMSALIGANIIATFAFHIFDVENMAAIDKHFRDQKLRKADEEIEEAITNAKVAEAKSKAGAIAAREAALYGSEQEIKDRTDKTKPAETMREAWENVKGFLPKWGKSDKRDELPAVAMDTVGLPTLANQPQPTEAQKQAARDFAAQHMYVPGDGRNPKDASQPSGLYNAFREGLAEGQGVDVSELRSISDMIAEAIEATEPAEATPSAGGSFQDNTDLHQSQDGGQDGGYIPTKAV